jgi:hypothetical protein
LNEGDNVNKQVYCSRKGAATIGKKTFPLPTVSEFLSDQIERQAKKMEARRQRRIAKALA